jgi:hypothetical protein
MTKPSLRPQHAAAAMIALAAVATVVKAAPGDILWNFRTDGFITNPRPTVAPDGTIYWGHRGLYALSPAGQVCWVRTDAGGDTIGVGPDSTAYASGSVNVGTPEEPFYRPTLKAVASDNTVLWDHPYDPGWGYPVAGPTVGPDGNIYALAFTGYRRPGTLFSVTPDGGRRWAAVNFAEGDFVTPLVFTDDLVVRATSRSGVVDPIFGYRAAVTTARMSDGSVGWQRLFAPAGDAVVSPLNHNVHVVDDLPDAVRTFAPDGTLLWTYYGGGTAAGLTSLGVGPDGTVYVFDGWRDLVALTPAGGVRWIARDIDPAIVPSPVAVSPSNDVVVFGSTNENELPTYVTAVRVTDGGLAWRTVLPRDPLYRTPLPFARPEFAGDGSAVYVPAVAICYAPECGGYATRGHVFAIQAGAACRMDLNADGSLTVQDFLAFLSLFAAADPRADWDGGGSVDIADFLGYIASYAAGCT